MVLKTREILDGLSSFHTRSEALKSLKAVKDEGKQDDIIRSLDVLEDVSENSLWALVQAMIEWQRPKDFTLLLTWAKRGFSFQKDILMALDTLSGFSCGEKELWQSMVDFFESETVLEYKFTPQKLTLLLDIDGERKQRLSMSVVETDQGMDLHFSSYCGIANKSHLEDIERVNREIAPRYLHCEGFQGNYKVFIREEQHWLSIVSHSLEDIILTLAHAADDLEKQLSGFDLDWKIDHD